MQAPSFPTTQEVDIHSTPIASLFITPVKAVYYSRTKALELFKLIREANPTISIGEFKAAYSVSDGVCDWMESQLEVAQ